MKQKQRTRKAKVSASAETPSGTAKPALIHPVVIYPFRHPDHYADLEELYGLVNQLDSLKHTYARPITVIDRKTHTAALRDKRYPPFRESVIARHSDIVDGWFVDTCQMWYSGLGLAFERGKADDVYWLIPGDFNYGSDVGRRVLGHLHDLPEICAELGQDVCIGEIATDHNNPKQLIDTYGTFALLYTWFPAEAREIRQYTERPRSEFFALRHAFLGELVNRRWYAYEQTIVTLLQAVFGRKHISRFLVGSITDLPEGRESLTSAIQQVERTERVLKTLWRERNETRAGWTANYRLLETQSEQVRRTAALLLENLLE